MNKILLIEDDLVTAELLKRKLENRGFRALIWSEQGTLSTFLKEEKIDVVLLDIVMPNKTGDEYLAEIREHYTQLELPVIMSTSKSDDDDVVDFLKRGANDYLTKPVNVDVGVQRIKTQIKLKESMTALKKSEEIKTVNKMVSTLSHEIRNPLTIALMLLHNLEESEETEKIEHALNRITVIMDKIHSLFDDSVDIFSDPTVDLYKLND